MIISKKPYKRMHPKNGPSRETKEQKRERLAAESWDELYLRVLTLEETQKEFSLIFTIVREGFGIMMEHIYLKVAEAKGIPLSKAKKNFKAVVAKGVKL